MPVKGIERVRSNLNATLNRITDQKTEAGVYALLSQGMAFTQLYVPIETSNLINSAYTPVITYNGQTVIGQVGFAAAYALAVHEASGKLKGQPRSSGSGDYWDPNAEPQFMVKGFDELKPYAMSILKEIYRV